MNAPRRGYLICTIGRSGSTHLCELLTSTGLLGRPEEYFNPDSLHSLGMPVYPGEPRRQLQHALQLGASPNGVYGLKIFPGQFDHFTYPNWMDDLPELRFVYLVRDDVLGQAISYVKAKQTNQWDTESQSTVSLGLAAYDEVKIQASLNEIVLDEARWRAYFARNGLEPLRLTYEGIVKDPNGSVAAIGAFLGLEDRPCIDSSKLRLKIQREDETLAWRARFVSKKRALESLDSNRISMRPLDSRVGSLVAQRSAASGKVVVWGAGSAALSLIRQRLDLASIDYFVDADVRKHGQTCLGLPIWPTDILRNENRCVVLISSTAHELGIRSHIHREYGDHVNQIISLDEFLHGPRMRATAGTD